MLIEHKELGQRSKAELESLFGNMYAGWDRGVVVTQERFGDGETRFSERPMSSMELAARYVAAEIGANIYEIAGRAAFAPIVTFSQIQIHLGPVFDAMAAQIEQLKAAEAREKEITRLATIEECAKVCDRWIRSKNLHESLAATDIAGEIRQLRRGQ